MFTGQVLASPTFGLTLKTVRSRADHTPTLIFDEIDQGIGGRVGAIVGQKLWGLTRAHQVLCITHLPQLAAYGDLHYHVAKQVAAGRTKTAVVHLVDDRRVTELARMLGADTEAGRASVIAMMSDVGAAKNNK